MKRKVQQKVRKKLNNVMALLLCFVMAFSVACGPLNQFSVTAVEINSDDTTSTTKVTKADEVTLEEPVAEPDSTEQPVDNSADSSVDTQIMPMSDELIDLQALNIDDYVIAGSTISKNPEDYVVGNTYTLNYINDFIILQILSQTKDFAGVNFQISKNLSQTGDKQNLWNLGAETNFVGIGSEATPFRGSIKCAWDSGVSFQFKTPLFQYLGEGAEVSNMDIICDAGCSAAIAKNIVGDVNIHDLKIYGEVTSTNQDAGILASHIGDDCDLTLSKIVVQKSTTDTTAITVSGLRAGQIAGTAGANVTITADADVSLKASVTGTVAAGGLYGELTGNASITDTLLRLLGQVTEVTGNGVTSYAGTIAGHITTQTDINSQIIPTAITYDITNTSLSLASLITSSTTGISGGMFGCMENGTTLTMAIPVTISGGVYGTCAGGLIGRTMAGSTVDLGSATVTCSAAITATTGCAGGIIGELNQSSSYTSGDITVTGAVTSAGTNAGGVFGLDGVGTVTCGAINVTGTISATVGNAGGYAGTLSASSELQNINVASVTGKYTGGILGSIAGSSVHVLLHDAAVKGTVTGTTATGGFIGAIGAGSAVEFGANLTLASEPTKGTDKGYYVGTQVASLLYFSVTGTVAKAGTTAIDEVGNYGGIYRNQAVTGGKLIGDGTLAKVGVINSGYKITEFKLNSAVDFECLAIVLNTIGYYGQGFFEVGSATNKLAAIQSAAYILPAGNIDISYDKTGIVTLNGNDAYRTNNYPFRGSMTGTTGTIITMNLNTHQSNIGLFSSLGGDNSFSNITLAGSIVSQKGMGALAYKKGTGTRLTLSDFTSSMNLSGFTSNGCGAVLLSGSKLTVDATNITLESTIDGGKNPVNYSGFITTLSNSTVNMNTVTLGGTITGTATSGTVGGFLGNTWTSTNGTVDTLTVKEGTSYMQPTLSFGALLNQVTSNNARFTLNDIDLKNLTVNSASAKGKGVNSSLLIYDATSLALEVNNYSAAGCNVYLNSNIAFDEIAGKTINEVGPSGIVSIHKDSSNYSDGYHYDNQATYVGFEAKSIQNGATMYFYDVFQKLDAINSDASKQIQISGDALTINSADQMVLLDAAVYSAGNANVQAVFANCISNPASLGNVKNVTIDGDIDLSKVSYYPIPSFNGITVKGINNAKITFGSNSGTEISTWSRPNTTSASQHYMLQGGLLLNPSNLNVSNLTLSGTCGNLGTNSGALVVGSLSNGGSFSNITCNNLAIDSYAEDGAALLIGNIPSGTVTFDNIKMTGYTNGNFAAAALIGTAGSATATNITLTFTNMVIADEAKTTAHNGNVLRYASFIYNYNYTNDASAYTGRGLYTFTEADADAKNGNVTYGKELDSETEFYDNDHNVLKTMNISADDYIPYIYQTKKIEVNPKTGDIIAGCGTYEDPYIISKYRQLLTLYRYMNETGTAGNYQYQSFYDGWKVNAIGSDTTFCNGTHTLAVFGDAATEASFPTPDALSHAYYRLDDDIDLSTLDRNSTYGIIAQQFMGFGTATRPFTGVWYGKGRDGNIHTITLPAKLEKKDDDDNQTETYTIYGFIAYAKGAVVKDMNIVVPEKTTSVPVIRTVVTQCYGGVYAYVLGGDNIIDNVTMTSNVKLSAASTYAGGYVGSIQKGGVIFRNITSASVTGINFISANNNTTFTNYYSLGSMIGRVEDGYALYEGSGNTQQMLLSSVNTELSTINGITACKNYNIVNGDYLLQQTRNTSDEQMSASISGTNITVTLPNSAALFVMSMALNSDALSASSNTATYASGYGTDSRCRKADYSNIGNCVATDADYIAAAGYDNTDGYTGIANTGLSYADSYLLQYFGLQNNDYQSYIIADGTNGYYSTWNAYKTINGSNYRTTYNLVAGNTYDVTGFGDSFRGIGAIYNPGGGNGSTFRGNFDGKGCTINYAINRKVLSTDSATVLREAALFNHLYGGNLNTSSDTAYKISNLQLTGSVNAATGYAALSDAGGVASSVQGQNFIFENVDLSNAFAIGSGNAVSAQGQNGVKVFGGIIGYISNGTNVNISGCDVIGTGSTQMVQLLGTGSGGGIVGQQAAESGNGNGDLTITNCSVAYTNVNSTGGNAGGMVGFAASGNSVSITGVANQNTVSNVSVTGNWQAAGVLGESRIAFNMDYITVDTVELNAWQHIGGVVGDCIEKKTSSLSNIKSLNVTITESAAQSAVSGLGGVIGNTNHVLTMSDITVTSPIINSNNTKARDQGSGGVIGINAGNLNLSNVTVEGGTVDTKRSPAPLSSNLLADKTAAGGMIGINSAQILMNGQIKTSDLTISATYTKLENSNQYLGYSSGCYLAAGGVIGMSSGAISGSSTTTSYNGLSTQNNAISGRQAGGLFGYLSGAVRLNGFDVNGGSIDSVGFAGGLAGCVNTSQLLIDHYTSEGVLVSNTIRNISVIRGRNVGGLIGNMDIGPNTLIEYVEISKCHIYGNDDRYKLSTNVNNASCVGGLYGSISGGSNELRTYHCSISENTIAAVYQSDSVNDNSDRYNVGGAIGRVFNNTKRAFFDDIVMTDNNVGVVSSEEKDVQLLHRMKTVEEENSLESVGLELSDMPVLSTENTNSYSQLAKEYGQEYGYSVGNYVGEVTTTSSDRVYFLNSSVTYGSNQKNIPVVDIGRQIKQKSTSVSTQTAENCQNACHIINNGDTDFSAISAEDANGVTTLNYIQEVLGSKTELGSKYVPTGNGKDTVVLNDYTNTYHVSQEAINMFEASYQSTYTFTADKTINHGMLIYSSQNGSIQDLLDDVADVMTNASGAPSTDEGRLYVSSAKVSYDTELHTETIENVAYDKNSSSASIEVSRSSGKHTFKYRSYDSLTGNILTYTLLTFTYTWKDTDNTEHTQVYKLPVFVEEIMTLDVNAKMSEGKVVSVDEAAKGVSGNIIMANDSEYTILYEYVYGNARTKQSEDETVDKTFYMTETSGGASVTKNIPAGTMITLIDVTHGNVPYYYTAATDVAQVSYSDFKSSSGDSYVNQPISKLENAGTDDGSGNYTYTDLNNETHINAGVEQYLFVVKSPTSTDTLQSNTTYQIHGGTVASDSLTGKTIITNNVDLNIDSLPSLQIAMVKTGTGATSASGTIAKNETVNANVTFTLNASDLYWNQLSQGGSVVDSQNHNKYLELAFYLRDAGNNRIYFPDNTNFRYKIGDGETYSDYATWDDTAVLNFYKEISSQYMISDIKKDTTVNVTMQFAFSTADLGGIDNEQYYMCIDLLRTADKDYPMGNNNILDSYSGQLNANVQNELGFAMNVDDYLELGINTYQSTEANHKISYKLNFDFEQILKRIAGQGEDDAIAKWAGYTYRVSYQFYKKTDTGYVLCSDTDLAKLQITDTVRDYTFTADEIRKCEDVTNNLTGEVTKGTPIQRANSLTVTTPSTMDLTNYKVVASLQIYSKVNDVETPIDNALTTSDFFIFTITKLKTDL